VLVGMESSSERSGISRGTTKSVDGAPLLFGHGAARPPAMVA
jgi:hypothetical protein